jgi:O-6-methylguanine DNA methyltransferase
VNAFLEQLRTSEGTFQIRATKKGVASIWFPHQRRVFSKRKNIQAPVAIRSAVKHAKLFMRRYFQSRSYPLRKVRIDWSGFAPFEKRVLKALLRIPPGKTTTYGELAKAAGSPRAGRAVGNVLHHNPLPILIPCHRVVLKNSALGSFSAGIKWKRKLLRVDTTIS